MNGFTRRQLLRESKNVKLSNEETQMVKYLVEAIQKGVMIDPMPSSSELEDWALQLITTFNTLGLMPLRKKKDVELAKDLFRRHLAVLKNDVEDRLSKLTA